MRLWQIFTKCAMEQKRDLWVLGLSVAFAPLFVIIYWLVTSAGGSTTYGVMVLNQDRGAVTTSGTQLSSGLELIDDMRQLAYKNGSPLLRILPVDDRTVAETRLRNRDAALLVIIPQDFSTAVLTARNKQPISPAQVEFVGDLTNPYYTIAAVSVMTTVDSFSMAAEGSPRPIQLLETALGGSSARTEFENYVPGLLILAIVLLVFQASIMVARESEGGKLKRLRLTGISAFEFLGGITAWLIVVAVFSLAITFLTAVLCGFRSQGPIWLALLISILACISIIGVGLIVASFAKTVTQAFIIANFPLGFFMFLTGAVFPLPRTNLFTLFGHGVAIYDFLPPTHAVMALNKIFTLGAGFQDIIFELVALTLLSALYFFIGVALFHKLNME